MSAEGRARSFANLNPRSSYNDICGRKIVPSSRSARIVGGGVANYAEWPWTVSHLRSLSGFIACSGFPETVQEGTVQAQVRSCASHQPLDHHGSPLCQSTFADWPKHSIFTFFQDIRPSNLLVRVGEYHVLNTNEPDAHVDRRIKKVVTHRSFDKITYEYDIALLEMHDGPIKYQVT